MNLRGPMLEKLPDLMAGTNWQIEDSRESSDKAAWPLTSTWVVEKSTETDSEALIGEETLTISSIL